MSLVHPHGGHGSTPPSCSTNPHAAIFLHYFMVWHSCGHLLLLPILTAAHYLRAILFFTFQPRPVFLRHSLLAILLPPRHLVFHFPTTSGTPTAGVQAAGASGLNSTYARSRYRWGLGKGGRNPGRRGAWKSPFHLVVPQALPLLKFKDELCIAITIPFP